MSLVQSFITKEFILVCGDQRAKLNNGTILENFVKVRKLNPTTIIGMTGIIEGNAKLFAKYIHSDFTLKESSYSQNYNDIVNYATTQFYENYDYLQENSVHSVVCGWDGQRMTGRSFFTKDDNPNMKSINDLALNETINVRFVNCGLNEHYINAEELKNSIACVDIIQFKNLFKNVIDIGVSFDDTINKNITFEKIRRIDVDERINKQDTNVSL